MGDWRLGRFMRTEVTYLTAQILGASCAKPNRQRVAIGWGANTANVDFNIYVDDASVATHIFYSGSIQSPWRVFSLRDSGDLCTRGFAVDGNGSANQAVVQMEWFLPESALLEADQYAMKLLGLS